MAQGDTFTDGANGSTAANTTDTIDVTAASGNHVAVHSLKISRTGGNTSDNATIFSRDTGSSTNWKDPSDFGTWLNTGGNKTTGEHDSLTGVKLFIDDTVGLRVEFVNTSCSSMTRSYAILGQQVK